MPADPSIEIPKQNSLSTLARCEIERRILGGEYPPGSKLIEADLAGELRVSRGPVREAFRALEQTGLVRSEQNRGVFVRQVSLAEANEIYEVRAALEGMIGRLAALRIRPERVEKVREVVKKMHAVGRMRDGAAYFPLNVEFHELLAEAAGNKALHANYRRVVNELDLYRRETLSRSAENIPISTKEHEAILNAVARGDAALAGGLLFAHVVDSRERLHQALAKPPAQPLKPARAA